MGLIHPELRRLQVSPTQIRLLFALSDGWRLRSHNGMFYLRDGQGSPSTKHPSAATVNALIGRGLIRRMNPRLVWQLTDKGRQMSSLQRLLEGAAS